MRLAAATSARFGLEVDIRHGELVGITDDVGNAAIFFDGPWWWETASEARA